MTQGLGSVWVVWALLCCSSLGSPTSDGSQAEAQAQGHGKLLYILMDGFKWDYVDQQNPSVLPGFTKILQDGGRAKWTNPLFPSLSYPTWTTLATGQYAETHGIVGNYFYDAETKEVFSLFDEATTGMEKWWTSEPIWTTAEKAGLRTAQYLWARCDVPIDGTVTEYCEHFQKIPGKAIFEKNIMNALDKFEEGFDLVQVYTEHTDNLGHNKGPNSTEVGQAVRDLDDVLVTLMDELEKRNLHDEVNMVIVSDHGMTDTTPGTIERHEIDDFLDTELVENIGDRGAFMNIKVPPENVDKVYEQVSVIPGVTAYRHDDIPDHFHFKNHKYIHDIILLADVGHFIMASNSSKQLPPRSDFVYIGAHGYNPELQDMKGIFFAKGPAFKCGWTIDPIHVVDIYQVLTHVLHVRPQPHNGTWSRVGNIFSDGDTICYSSSSDVKRPPVALLISFITYILSSFIN